MNGFKAFFKGKTPIEVYADSSYAAQCQAAVLWNLKPSKRCEITVVCCEVKGEQVTHSTTEL